MIGKVRAALRQQHLQSDGSIDEWDQDRSGRRCAFSAGQAETVGQIARGRRSGASEGLHQPVTLIIG